MNQNNFNNHYLLIKKKKDFFTFYARNILINFIDF